MKKIVKVKNVEIGKGFCVIAGPCAIESEEQLRETAKAIKDKIDILRGGAFKPRTSPKNFQGMGKEGLELLKKIGEEIGKPTVTEVVDTRDVELVVKYTDILQIGARNMQNFSLLKEAGKSMKPILLKRGLSSTIDEWAGAAEYILAEGNNNIILCERGIRTFETSTRFTLDLAGAVLAELKLGFPVIADPSHATGNPELIPAMARAAKAAGLSGVMIEVHWRPETAKCDAKQALTPEQFNKIFT